MLAAAVTLLLVAEFVAAVAEPPTVPAPVALELEPAVERLLAVDPFAPVLALDTAAVPVVTTAPIPVVEVLLALFGTALIAVTPVVVAPEPLTVPTVAAPPLPAPLLVLPGFVLDVVVVPAEDVAALGVVASCSFGSVTAPVPTCPPPSEPGVALVAGVVAVVCAATGDEMPSDTITTRGKIVFKSRPQRRVTAIPDRDWRRR